MNILNGDERVRGMQKRNDQNRNSTTAHSKWIAKTTTTSTTKSTATVDKCVSRYNTASPQQAMWWVPFRIQQRKKNWNYSQSRSVVADLPVKMAYKQEINSFNFILATNKINEFTIYTTTTTIVLLARCRYSGRTRRLLFLVRSFANNFVFLFFFFFRENAGTTRQAKCRRGDTGM